MIVCVRVASAFLPCDRSRLTTMRLGTVAILLAVGVYVRGQTDVNVCRDRCNVAMCLQNSEIAINRETNRDIANAVIGDCYNAASTPTGCDCNIGVVNYDNETPILDTDVCPLFPHIPTRVPEHQCVFAASTAQQMTAPNPPNNLEQCLNYISNDASFLQVSQSVDCRYTVAVVCNRDLLDPVAVRQAAQTLANKGAVIHCFLVGNQSEPRSPGLELKADSGICDTIFEAADANALWDNIEQMYASLQCCDDPVPPVPTPTTTTTTTTPPRPVEPCDEYTHFDGIGYSPHPTRGDCYNRCIFGADGTVEYTVECCERGFIWDQDFLMCMPATDLACSRGEELVCDLTNGHKMPPGKTKFVFEDGTVETCECYIEKSATISNVQHSCHIEKNIIL